MNTLKITTLDRVPVQAGDTRYWFPGPSDPIDVQGSGGYAIIVEPLSPDNLGATDGSQIGSVRAITPWGLRIVDTVSLGVLVSQE